MSDGRTVVVVLLLLLLPCSLNTVETSGPTSKLIPTHNGTIKVDAFWNPFATGLGQMVRWVAQISRNWPTSKSRVISWNLPPFRSLSAPRTISLVPSSFCFISTTFYLSDSSWVWHWFDFILWTIVCSLRCPLCQEFVTSAREKGIYWLKYSCSLKKTYGEFVIY